MSPLLISLQQLQQFTYMTKPCEKGVVEYVNAAGLDMSGEPLVG